MIKVNFEIDDETQSFDVPEQWDEVTVGQFMELVELQVSSKEEKNPFNTVMRMTTILTGIPLEIIEMVPVEQFHLIQDTLKYSKEDVNIEKRESVTIGDEEFYIKNDFNSLTMGETITIETLVKDAGDNIMRVFDKMLCVFLRKKTKKGNLESFKSVFIEERSEMFRGLSIESVYAIMIFFSDGVTTSEGTTKTSLETKK